MQRLDEYLNVEADQPRVTHRSLATDFGRRFCLIATHERTYREGWSAGRGLISSSVVIYFTL
jgi:hypothetical protein